MKNRGESGVPIWEKVAIAFGWEGSGAREFGYTNGRFHKAVYTYVVRCILREAWGNKINVDIYYTYTYTLYIGVIYIYIYISTPPKKRERKEGKRNKPITKKDLPANVLPERRVYKLRHRTRTGSEMCVYLCVC